MLLGLCCFMVLAESPKQCETNILSLCLCHICYCHIGQSQSTDQVSVVTQDRGHKKAPANVPVSTHTCTACLQQNCGMSEDSIPPSSSCFLFLTLRLWFLKSLWSLKCSRSVTANLLEFSMITNTPLWHVGHRLATTRILYCCYNCNVSGYITSKFIKIEQNGLVP